MNNYYVRTYIIHSLWTCEENWSLNSIKWNYNSYMRYCFVLFRYRFEAKEEPAVRLYITPGETEQSSQVVNSALSFKYLQVFSHSKIAHLGNQHRVKVNSIAK